MKKILISFENQNIIFSYKNHKKMREDLINTNIISDNELIFGIDYLEKNQKIVSNFIKELCEIKKLSQAIFGNNEIATLLIPFFDSNEFISRIYLKNDETLTYKICESLIQSHFIKYINCYNIPSYMIEILDAQLIQVESRSEFFYVSNFMIDNNLVQYSKMYYKLNVRITFPLSEEDRIDFITFSKVNRYLKCIKCTNYQQDDIHFIIKTLKENRLKNVTIQIPGMLMNEQSIIDIKEINKDYKRHKIKCTLHYSENYLQENIFKQMIINTIKVCGLITVILVGSVIAFVGTRNYIAMKKDTAIGDYVKDTMKEQIPNPPNDTPPSKEELIIKNHSISSLLSINPDVVGWLKVNNTNIDYPVVRAEDNEIYLKNNLYKEKDENGWIYMDYRNTDDTLKKNTIIYGHNMYYSGIMFGTLHKTANKSWYGKEENLILSFNTMYETMNWQIFSIYKIKKTQDYLHVDFANDQDFNDYIDMIKKRSIANINTPVNEKDHILTLSTCTGDNERFVVHAKLITN